jgi:hypothetical protein
VAILLALQMIESVNHKKFVILPDSISCLQAIHSQKLASPFICEILEKIGILLAAKQIKFCWLPSHIGIKGNESADAAAKAALALPQISNYRLPYSDFKPHVNKYLHNVWQNQWNQAALNKLNTVKPTLGETKLNNINSRRDEVVMHRVRIGHCFLTHCYLLRKEPAPECPHCQCLLSVKHLLLDCPLYNGTRTKYFHGATLHHVFNMVQPKSTIQYLKEIGQYEKI